MNHQNMLRLKAISIREYKDDDAIRVWLPHPQHLPVLHGVGDILSHKDSRDYMHNAGQYALSTQLGSHYRYRADQLQIDMLV